MRDPISIRLKILKRLLFFFSIQLIPLSFILSTGLGVVEASVSESKELMNGKVIRVAVLHVSAAFINLFLKFDE